MNLEEVKQFLEQNKDDEQVKEYLQGLQSDKKVTVEEVQQLAQQDSDVKKWLDSEKDRHANKSLETWKNNNLESLVEDEVKKRNPQKDEKDIEIDKIKQQLADMEGQKTKESLRNSALKQATDKGIPHDVIDYLLGDDEESTLTNLSTFEKSMQQYVDSKVNERVKGSSYTPPASDDGNTKTFTPEELNEMSIEEVNAQWDTIKDSSTLEQISKN
ncbi:DUF4355 domain-containing protein [Salsuginibacillus kocurii]|uniref:DUF4355 domain-containing protein n=1 Tax=Salsuginibacillus kocurii TaxID=427078 RepID=UPI00035C6A78|nr:DUF4355 domain-containing protein [Salsuginibacillus kocurii]